MDRLETGPALGAHSRMAADRLAPERRARRQLDGPARDGMSVSHNNALKLTARRSWPGLPNRAAA